MTPKFHWLLHLWKTLQRNNALLNCFCLERKHRMPKRYATDITNAQKLNSASLLMEVTCHHLSQLQQLGAFQFSLGLVDSCPASRKVKRILSSELGFEQDGDAARSIKVSTTCRFSPVAICHKTDFVLFKDGIGGKVGKIKLHFKVLGVAFSIISVLAIHQHESQSAYSVWIPLHHEICIEADQILDTLVYSELPDGKIAALLPLDVRSPG